MGFFVVFSPTHRDRRDRPSFGQRGHFKKYTAPLAVPITEKDCESQAAKAPEGLEVLKQRSVFCNGGCWPVGRLGKELKVVFVVERDVFFYL